jgi:hypothetical protein
VNALSRSTQYIRIALLLAIFATVAAVLGSEPWGPW